MNSSPFLPPLSTLTPAVRAYIQAWSTRWADRNWNLPPEALDLDAIVTPEWATGWLDIFMADVDGIQNPLRTAWFESLPATAIRGDVARLDAAFGPHPIGRVLARFVLSQLAARAWMRDCAGIEVSPTLPAELLQAGVPMPPEWTWNCTNNQVQHEREVAATTQLLTDLLADAETTLLGFGPPTATPPGSTDASPVPSTPSPRTVNLVAVRQAAESRLRELTGFSPDNRGSDDQV